MSEGRGSGNETWDGGGKTRLGEQIRRLAVGRRVRLPTGDADGASAYEQVTRRGLEDLTKEVERIELKVNGILVAVGSAVLVEIVKTVAR